MICILGVCHKEIVQAEKWLRHVADLSVRETPDQPRLFVMLTQRAHAESRDLKRTKARVDDWPVCADESEAGYPLSASHLFLRALEWAEAMHPGEPVLWLEADTLPMRPGWRAEIALEYSTCGKPFMGCIERGHGFAHLAGVAVYPPDWRMKAPLLAGVLAAPDIFWGKGLGQAFDTWAAPETVPQAAEAKSIFQLWRPTLPITRPWLRVAVPQDVALFHQVKDGSGFKAVREDHRL
jgi:hypothetical protein